MEIIVIAAQDFGALDAIAQMLSKPELTEAMRRETLGHPLRR